MLTFLNSHLGSCGTRHSNLDQRTECTLGNISIILAQCAFRSLSVDSVVKQLILGVFGVTCLLGTLFVFALTKFTKKPDEVVYSTSKSCAKDKLHSILRSIYSIFFNKVHS